MEIITSTAIEPLRTLHAQLCALQQQEFDQPSTSATTRYTSYPRSEYSVAMVQCLIDIIEELLEHNELCYWENQTRQDWLMSRILHIDGSRGTYVPEVFNAESRALAQRVAAFLESIDIESIFTLAAKTLLTTSLGDLSTFLKTIQTHLTTNLAFYHLLEKSAADEKKGRELLEEIQVYFDQFLVSKDKGAIAFDPEAYEEKIISFIQRTRGISYVYIWCAAFSLNKEWPISKDVDMHGNIGVVMGRLVSKEQALNTTFLKEKGLPLVHCAYLYCRNALSEALCDEREAFLTQLKDDFFTAVRDYKEGKHLGSPMGGLFKRTPDVRKMAILTELEEKMDRMFRRKTHSEYPQRAPGVRSLMMAQYLQSAIKDNMELCHESELPIDFLSTLLNNQAFLFLQLPLAACVQGDLGLLRELMPYEDAFSAEIKAIPKEKIRDLLVERLGETLNPKAHQTLLKKSRFVTCEEKEPSDDATLCEEKPSDDATLKASP